MKFIAGGDVEYQLDLLLNQGLELQDNLRGSLVQVTTIDGVTEVQHNLGYTPLGFLILNKNGEGDIWTAEAPPWTKTHLYLRSSVPNLEVLLFVL